MTEISEKAVEAAARDWAKADREELQEIYELLGIAGNMSAIDEIKALQAQVAALPELRQGGGVPEARERCLKIMQEVLDEHYEFVDGECLKVAADQIARALLSAAPASPAPLDTVTEKPAPAFPEHQRHGE